MQIKRGLSIAACAMLIVTSSITVHAMEQIADVHSQTISHTKENGIMPLASFSVSVENLKPNWYDTAQTTYTVGKWDELDYDAEWTPVNTTLNIMLVNVEDTSKIYMESLTQDDVAKDGKAHGIFILRGTVPPGEYYVGVGNDSSNNVNISAHVTFEWH